MLVPSRPLWRVSAGWDTAKVGWLRGGCSRAGWGAVVRQLRLRMQAPSISDAAGVFASYDPCSAGGGCVDCHGREPVPLSFTPQPATCLCMRFSQAPVQGRTAAAPHGIVCTQPLQRLGSACSRGTGTCTGTCKGTRYRYLYLYI
jgi:hypothetical protein